MKVLIAYAGKTGTCAACAQKLAQLVPGAEVFDLSKQQPDPAHYDVIVLGASVRIRMINRLALRFAKENQTMLDGKPLAIYLTSCDIREDSVKDYFAKSELSLLSKKAFYADSLGGLMELDKQKGFDRFIVKMISKSKDHPMTVPGIQQDRVSALAEAIKAQDIAKDSEQ